MAKVTESNPLGAGRPKVEFGLDDVAYLCSIDCTEVETAAALGCSPPTLRRRMAEWGEPNFERFRVVKQAAGRAVIRRQLQEIASGSPLAHSRAALPALTANIWLSKQRLGYTDRQQTEIKHLVRVEYVELQPPAIEQLSNNPISDYKQLPADSSNPLSDAP